MQLGQEFFQFGQYIQREAGEIVDKIERIPDFVQDTGCQLAHTPQASLLLEPLLDLENFLAQFFNITH